MGFFQSSGILNRRGFFGGAAAVAPPAFAPTDISGCKLWVSADYGIITSGSTITQITDRSPNSNTLYQSSGNLSLSSNIINGKPAFYFQGARFSGNDIVTAKTIYAAIKTGGSPPNGDAAILEATGGSLYSSIGSQGFGSYLNYYYGSGSGFSTNSPYIISTISDDGQTCELRRNGATARADSDGGGFYTREALYFGNDSSNGQPSNCYVAECVVYDRAITNSEAQQLETYLNNKYAVY